MVAEYNKRYDINGFKIMSNEMANIRFPLPPLSEQRLIANFLDSKCSEIDSLAGNLTKRSENLKEYRKAVITEAVTKGVDKKAKMKNSGIEWIGEIPETWKVTKIKYLIVQNKNGIKIGPFGSALSNKIVDNGEYNVYGQANLINSDFSSTKNTINKRTFDSLSSYEVMPGDICVSMMGTIGKCKVVPQNIKQGIMDSHLIKLRLSNTVLDRFFEYVYDKDNSGICFTQMQYEKTGSIMDGLNTSIVKRIVIPLPPLSEQRLIADYLDTKCSEIDKLMQNYDDQLTSLAEYKKSLIYEYVTGKKNLCGLSSFYQDLTAFRSRHSSLPALPGNTTQHHTAPQATSLLQNSSNNTKNSRKFIPAVLHKRYFIITLFSYNLIKPPFFFQYPRFHLFYLCFFRFLPKHKRWL